MDDVAHLLFALHQVQIIGIAGKPQVQRLDGDVAFDHLIVRQIDLSGAAA